MEIVALKGIELEKALPNSPEDGFTRSEVTYIKNEKEHVLKLLYVRYFEELLLNEIPYTEQPLFHTGTTPCNLKDIMAYVYLLANPEAEGKKEVYISDEGKLINAFKDVDWKQVELVFSSVSNGGKAEVQL